MALESLAFLHQVDCSAGEPLLGGDLSDVDHYMPYHRRTTGKGSAPIRAGMYSRWKVTYTKPIPNKIDGAYAVIDRVVLPRCSLLP